MQDHNTRLIVIGRDVAEARYVAEALVHEAFQNVGYFHGSLQEAQAALKPWVNCDPLEQALKSPS